MSTWLVHDIFDSPWFSVQAPAFHSVQTLLRLFFPSYTEKMRSENGTYLITGACPGVGLSLVKNLLSRVSTTKVFACMRNTNDPNDLIKISEGDPRLLIIELDVDSENSIKVCLSSDLTLKRKISWLEDSSPPNKCPRRAPSSPCSSITLAMPKKNQHQQHWSCLLISQQHSGRIRLVQSWLLNFCLCSRMLQTRAW